MRSASLLLLSFLLTSAASAQTFEEMSFLRLNDTTPRSTRAVALGGASDPLGDADMAANPATLAAVKKPMFVVQGARNSIGITQTTIGSDNLPVAHSAWIDGTSLSQVAAAFPLHGVVVGAYYASEPRLQSPDALAMSFGTTPYTPAACPNICGYALPVADLAFERRDRRGGLGVAWESGAFAVGAGAELQQLDERSESGRDIVVRLPPGQNERIFRRINDRAIVPNAGIRWLVTPRVALAAAYNGAGSFTRTTSACNVNGIDFSACSSAVAQIGQSTVRMPDAYRAGLSIAATDRLRLVGEAVRRNYSTLANDSYTIMSDAQRLSYHDVTELHAGAEYRLASVALRAGWWRDPSRYGFPSAAAGRTLTHRTVGAGINVGGARLDFAYDDANEPMQRRAVVGLAFGL